jgi:hypothetical protein
MQKWKLDSMKKTKTDRERLVGALGGAGGALALVAFFNYLFYQSWWEDTWLMNVAFGITGIFFISLAILIHFRK